MKTAQRPITRPLCSAHPCNTVFAFKARQSPTKGVTLLTKFPPTIPMNSASSGTSPVSIQTAIPHDFVRLQDHIPGLLIDLKYAGNDNFVGRPVPGYEGNCAVLTRVAADALALVQAQLTAQGLALKVLDAYRPQRAVDYFGEWAASPGDEQQKALFYPALEKTELIPNGYIAPQSGHSRGSTVDVTIIRLADASELDMGTAFDFFGPQSWTHFAALTPAQIHNRGLLQKLMAAHGFVGIREEWWHFTLKDEPYPATSFDFTAR